MADVFLKPNQKLTRMWGGFMDGRLHTLDADTGWGGYGNGTRRRMPAIFTTRKAARAEYRDVRRIWVVTEAPSHG